MNVSVSEKTLGTLKKQIKLCITFQYSNYDINCAYNEISSINFGLLQQGFPTIFKLPGNLRQSFNLPSAFLITRHLYTLKFLKNRLLVGISTVRDNYI